MTSLAQQNSVQYLQEISVHFESGHYLDHEIPSESSMKYSFDITKANMQELYEATPEWGWHGKNLFKKIKWIKLKVIQKNWTFLLNLTFLKFFCLPELFVILNLRRGEITAFSFQGCQITKKNFEEKMKFSFFHEFYFR